MNQLTDKQVIVSVCCATYNHEKFIWDAIEGFLMQKTDFPFEILIHDDASTDSTPEIIREYAEKYPGLIVPIFQSENQYSQGKRILGNFLLPRARGKYIALCEGDDYWTSPHKLQLQVDYMEAHPECRICFHAAEVVYEDDPGRPHSIRTPPPNLTTINLESWLKHRAKYPTFMATSSVLYRSVPSPLPQWYFHLRYSGDWALFTWLLLQGGQIGFLNSPILMSVYRKHSGGVTHTTSSSERVSNLLNDLHDHTIMSQHLNSKARSWLKPRFYLIHKSLVNSYLANGNPQKAKEHLIKLIQYVQISSIKELSTFLKLLIRCYLPKLYLKLTKSRALSV